MLMVRIAVVMVDIMVTTTVPGKPFGPVPIDGRAAKTDLCQPVAVLFHPPDQQETEHEYSDRIGRVAGAG